MKVTRVLRHAEVNNGIFYLVHAATDDNNKKVTTCAFHQYTFAFVYFLEQKKNLRALTSFESIFKVEFIYSYILI